VFKFEFCIFYFSSFYITNRLISYKWSVNTGVVWGQCRAYCVSIFTKTSFVKLIHHIPINRHWGSKFPLPLIGMWGGGFFFGNDKYPQKFALPLNWNVGGNFCGNDKFPYSQYSHIFFHQRNGRPAISKGPFCQRVTSNMWYQIFHIQYLTSVKYIQQHDALTKGGSIIAYLST